MGSEGVKFMKHPLMLIYTRSLGDIKYSTKIKVFGTDTMIFLETETPPDATREVRKRFISDAFFAGKKYYDDLYKR